MKLGMNISVGKANAKMSDDGDIVEDMQFVVIRTSGGFSLR
jgi:hypothetical protein